MQIRTLNAIYIQATSLSLLQDIADFLIYCQCWYETLEHHHRVEEEFFFPELEKRLDQPGLMDRNVEQHRAFHEKLDLWGKKCYELKAKDYNGVMWRNMIDDFAVPLLKHLHDEIDTMEDLAKYDPEGVIMLELWKELDEKTVAEADKVGVPTALLEIDSDLHTVAKLSVRAGCYRYHLRRRCSSLSQCPIFRTLRKCLPNPGRSAKSVPGHATLTTASDLPKLYRPVSDKTSDGRLDIWAQISRCLEVLTI